MDNLTEAQRKRIEENRRKALERRAASIARQQAASNISVQHGPGSNQSVNVFCKEGLFAKPNLQASASFSPAQSYSPSLHVQASSINVYANKPSVSLGVKPVTSQSSIVTTATSSSASASKTYEKNVSFGPAQVKGTFSLLTRKRFFVDIGYHQQMIEVFRSIPSRVYDAKTKRWNFAIEDHGKLVEKLMLLKPNVVFSPLPASTIQLFSNVSVLRDIPQHDLSCLDPVLHNSLMPFQRDGVNFGIHLGGKVLIADDMGLGKTIQAIAVANYYKDDWPLLVVTPSSVRYSWAEAFCRWLPSLGNDLTIINCGKDHIPSNKVTILSYDLLTKKKDEILRRGFKSIILDESHFLKNYKSARTRAAQEVMKQLKRIIMLSGTPALSRPIELFPQVSALKPKLFPSLFDFGIRYCDGKKTAWGWDFTGSSNMQELRLILEETVMIRRLKSDVIKQLPSKIRQIVMLDTAQLASKNKTLIQFSKKMCVSNLKAMERRGVLLEYFHETGITKLPSICEYIRDLLEKDSKFLCFAHHHIVLDGISKELNDRNIMYIRIDGSTSSEQRKERCDKFQLNDKCKVALLSITAANAGITLTAAHLVVFAELFWNPGILVQAEDRVHRIGQEDSVVVQYLVAKGTADDEIWPMVQKKLDILNKAGLSKDNFKNSETFAAENSKQPCIEDFWQELNSAIDLESSEVCDDDISAKRQKL